MVLVLRQEAKACVLLFHHTPVRQPGIFGDLETKKRNLRRAGEVWSQNVCLLLARILLYGITYDFPLTQLENSCHNDCLLALRSSCHLLLEQKRWISFLDIRMVLLAELGDVRSSELRRREKFEGPILSEQQNFKAVPRAETDLQHHARRYLNSPELERWGCRYRKPNFHLISSQVL